MAARRINILIGCIEPVLVQCARFVLSTADKGRTAFDFTEASRCDDIIREACNGDFGVVLIYANCVLPTAPLTLLEHSILAIKTIKSARAVPVVAFTSMEEWQEPLRAAGADHCLPLPHLLTDLKNAVFRCVDRHT